MKYTGSAIFVYKPVSYHRVIYCVSFTPTLRLSMQIKFVSDKQERVRSRFPSKSVKEEILGRFIVEKSLPLVGYKSMSSAAQYDSIPVTVVTLYADVDVDKNFKGYQYFANRMRKIATDTEFAGKFIFNIADKDDFSGDLKLFGLTKPANKNDVVVGLRDNDVYYKLDTKGAFNADNIVSFLRDFKAGLLNGKVKVSAEVFSVCFC